MSEEEIIRHEANSFFSHETCKTRDFGEGSNGYMAFVAPNIFKGQLEKRLPDFFESKSKAYFLDEVMRLLKNEYDSNFSKNSPISLNVRNFYSSVFYVQQFIDELPTLVTTKNQRNSKTQRNSIFVSYSHHDRDYVDSFKRHFKILERQHGLDLWDDSRIQPGQKWEEEIRKAMQKAKIAIFVVSADFFASDFIFNKELPELLKATEEEGAKVLSIIVKPCDFSNTPLGIYQAMNNPTHTLLHMSELQKEELWVNLVSEVRKILEL